MLQHQGSIRIETERLILRPFKPEDGEAMFNNWTSDPEVTRYLTWPTHEKLETTNYILGLWLADNGSPKSYRWAIVDKANGNEPVGCIDVVNMNEDLERAEIGYCLSRRYWNKGVMSESLKAVIDHLFQCGFTRVEACHNVDNPASGRVMLKSGMLYEGITRCGRRTSSGAFCDVAQYAIVNTDSR